MFSLCSTFTRLHVRAPTPLRPKGVRHKVQLAPRKANFVRRHQGRVGIPIGGSIKGTTLKFGDWGLRVKVCPRLLAITLYSLVAHCSVRRETERSFQLGR